MTLFSELRDYLRDYWKHVTQSPGRKALMASTVWLAGMFVPIGLKTVVALPEWAPLAWMIGWAVLGYLIAPYGMWKVQRRKIEELQSRTHTTRISK